SFLIGVWGGPRREYAAIKFFLYTLLGSALILIPLLAFYFTNVRDFVPAVAVNTKAGEIVSQRTPGLPPAEYQKRVEAERANVTINTFDMVLLQKVGRAASEVIEGREVAGVGTREKNPLFEQWFFTPG